VVAHLDEGDGAAALGHASHLGADAPEKLRWRGRHRAALAAAGGRCRHTGSRGTRVGRGRARGGGGHGGGRHPARLVGKHEDEQRGTLNRVRQVGVGDHVLRELDALPNGEATA
jgi:hypothetical protein